MPGDSRLLTIYNRSGKLVNMPSPSRTAAAAPSASAIALLRTHSLATLAHRELERRILAGELSSGAKLDDAEVAAQLGISRGPIREAFRALEESGLVRVEKNRGVFVRQVSMAEADDIYDVRASLDETIGRRVAARATPEQLERLRELIAKMENAAAGGNTGDYYAANIMFHDSLAQFAANAKLLDIYRKLVNELSLYRRKTIERGGAILPTSMREHKKIVEAIATRDEVAAGRLMFEHAMASRERMHDGQKPARPPRRMMRSIK
ncbi:MAG: phosphonate utilization associated transcriptional regulator [Betaproteobacteria bacterium]